MAVAKVCQLAAEVGYPPADLPDRLRIAGLDVVQSHASGYRRPLLKALALTAITHV